jgi:glutamyl-tRNA synthetase
MRNTWSARLSHGDQEIFSTEEMIAAFDLPQIGCSPARFDFAKLESLNGHYMRSSSDSDLWRRRQVAAAPAGRRATAAKLTPAVREQSWRPCPN